MIEPVSNLRNFSASFIEELCFASAREASPPDATEAEIVLRAQFIMLFVCGWLTFPSRSIH